MAGLAVRARAGAPNETDADTRVVGVFEGESLDQPELQALVDSGEAKPAATKLAVAHETIDGRSRRVLLVGLGKRDELDPEKARVGASVAAGRAREIGAKSLSWASPAGDGVPGALVEGTVLSLYRFERFKSSVEPDETSTIELLE